MAEITVKTKVPLTNGKEATFTLEDGEVAMRLPISFSTPAFALADLRAAVDELEATQMAQEVEAKLKEGQRG